MQGYAWQLLKEEARQQRPAAAAACLKMVSRFEIRQTLLHDMGYTEHYIPTTSIVPTPILRHMTPVSPIAAHLMRTQCLLGVLRTKAAL